MELCMIIKWNLVAILDFGPFSNDWTLFNPWNGLNIHENHTFAIKIKKNSWLVTELAFSSALVGHLENVLIGSHGTFFAGNI